MPTGQQFGPGDESDGGPRRYALSTDAPTTPFAPTVLCSGK